MSVNNINPDEKKIESFLKRFQGDTKNTDIPRAKNELQKDDFTKLMLTQIKYQDPLNPMDNKEMGRQLAQMASIEQLQNVNAGITGLRQDQKPMGRMNLVGLIGQTVEVDVGRIDHTKGSKEQLSFDIPSTAYQGEFEVVDGTGQVIYSKSAPVDGVGNFDFKWDGKTTNGKVAESGTLFVRAKLTDKSGAAIPFKTSSQGKIAGLDFRGDKSILILENGNKVDFTQVKSIGLQTADGGQEASQKAAAVLDPTKPMAMIDGEWKNTESVNAGEVTQVTDDQKKGFSF